MSTDHLTPSGGQGGHVSPDAPTSARARAEALFVEGNARWQAGDTSAAEACFRQALALVPDVGEVLANLALLRERAGDAAQAERLYVRALACAPDVVQIHVNFGVMLHQLKRFAQAEAVYRAALARLPGAPMLWTHLGVLLACLKREAEAQACHRHALALDPAYRVARFNLAYLLLRQARHAEGWACLEARTQADAWTPHFRFARWQGESLQGRSILIAFEGGHGDVIQFCRYATLLKRLGAVRVGMLCQPGLASLLASQPDLDELLTVDGPVPRDGWDCWTMPLSLPHRCDTRADTIPAQLPYLSADPARVHDWSARLPATGCRIGLVWQGNPRFENDADRSIPSLDALLPLAEVAAHHPDVQWISLQKGPGEAQASSPPAGLPLHAIGHRLRDFSDTAAVVAQLDLVISVDTAVAHLAGALARPVWLLLPDYRPDWRWLADRDDSPWYPGVMRLFRQSAGEAWPSVLRRVAAALADGLRNGDSAASPGHRVQPATMSR